MRAAYPINLNQAPIRIGGAGLLYDLGPAGVLKVSYPLLRVEQCEVSDVLDEQRNYWLGRTSGHCVDVKAIDAISVEQSTRICVLMENLSDWECDVEKFATSISAIRKCVRKLRDDSIHYVDVKPRNVLFRKGSCEFKLVDLPISTSFGMDLIFSVDQYARDNYVSAYRDILCPGQTTTQTLLANNDRITTIPVEARRSDSPVEWWLQNLTTQQDADGG